eukprot:TRINITY_DN531_c0_g1_i2.p1 TRINITY_DN531_c0_g1~~TRINITY_DN531_c0_g1_i2.p1  ORF type:complete len:240 (-),score=12.35 TRINITY_DN531_c0_g1_i2:162-881(-)
MCLAFFLFVLCTCTCVTSVRPWLFSRQFQFQVDIPRGEIAVSPSDLDDLRAGFKFSASFKGRDSWRCPPYRESLGHALHPDLEASVCPRFLVCFVSTWFMLEFACEAESRESSSAASPIVLGESERDSGSQDQSLIAPIFVGTWCRTIDTDGIDHPSSRTDDPETYQWIKTENEPVNTYGNLCPDGMKHLLRRVRVTTNIRSEGELHTVRMAVHAGSARKHTGDPFSQTWSWTNAEKRE